MTKKKNNHRYTEEEKLIASTKSHSITSQMRFHRIKKGNRKPEANKQTDMIMYYRSLVRFVVDVFDTEHTSRNVFP